MIRKYLQQAHDYGHEVVVQFNYFCNARYMGKILDLGNTHFCLLHMGEKHTMSWIFKIEDVKYFGVYKENILPSYSEKQVTENIEKEV